MQEAQFLDLHRDDIAKASGKWVKINGADYVLLDLLADGSKSCVYPIRNCRSGLTRFVAKFLKFQPDSPEYAALSENGWQAVFTTQCMGVSALHVEYYKIPGGLFCLQRSLAMIKDPAGYEPQMNAATTAGNSGRFAEAVNLYQEVLRNNPNHTDAMINSAAFLPKIGAIGQALALLDKAKAIEPNVREVYYQIALILAWLGNPAAALATIDETLRRWKYDYESIQRQVAIAIDFDFVDVVEQRLSEVQAWAGQLGQLAKFQAELEICRTRLAEARNLASQGAAARSNNDWGTAITCYSQAAGITKDNALYQLNEFVCRYHLGETVDWKAVGSLIPRSPPPANHGTVLLAALFAVRGKDWAQAGTFFGMLDQIASLWDLPGVPLGFIPAGRNAWATLEEKSVKPLIELLQMLTYSGALPGSSGNAVGSLLKKYQQREEQVFKNPLPGS
jgi:tetratricopeptide (TPR) repeat protein